MTPARLSDKRRNKEQRRRVIRASRRRRNFERARMMRKFRVAAREEMKKRKKQQIKIETAKPEPPKSIAKEAPKKRNWISRVFGRKTGG